MAAERARTCHSQWRAVRATRSAAGNQPNSLRLTPAGGVALVPPRRDGVPPWGCGCCPFGPAHSDRETSVGRKRTPEPRTRWYWAGFRHRDRIQHGGDDGCVKDADRKTTGPGHLLPAPGGSLGSAVGRGRMYNRELQAHVWGDTCPCPISQIAE
jgi:hypothetical protein